MQQGSILPFLQKGQPSRPENSRSGHPYHSRPPQHRGNSTKQHHGSNRRRNMDLERIAEETKAELPKILSQLMVFDSMESSVHRLADLIQHDAKDCPGFTLPPGDVEAGKKGTRIKVFDMDTYDAAISISPTYTAQIHMDTYQSKAASTDSQQQDEDQIMEDAPDDVNKADPDTRTSGGSTDRSSNHAPRPVAVLNLASERKAGGGWQNGALAQEEALCYRSSLYLSLYKSYYPLPSLSAIYSPSVLIIRDAMSRGHTLLTPTQPPTDLPVTSVISVAALRRPALSEDKEKYKNEGQRAETKRKIRLTLRVAAMHGHTKIVLGALGCGVFANPPKEVAKCFLEVMRETEFQGGWWEEVVFAILDNVKGEQSGKDGIGNYGVFYRVLDGQIV